jgi:hypothetical protein
VPNNLDRNQYRQDLRDANWVARRTAPSAILWVIGIIAILGLIGGGIWGFKVLTSDVRGAGDVVRKTNDANNRIFAQQHFQEIYNEIKAYDQQLDQAAADKAANPGDRYYAINYSGLVKQCIDARAQYDADANKVTQARWRDPELPQQIDITDPTTDCKEAQK